MKFGERFRTMREERNFSQGDIEKRTGLLRCYISRVENGHTVPSLQTIEKLAFAMEVPLYRFFYEGNGVPKPPEVVVREAETTQVSVVDNRWFRRLRKALSVMEERDRRLLLDLGARLAMRKAQARDRKLRTAKRSAVVRMPRQPFRQATPDKVAAVGH